MWLTLGLSLQWGTYISFLVQGNELKNAQEALPIFTQGGPWPSTSNGVQSRKMQCNLRNSQPAYWWGKKEKRKPPCTLSHLIRDCCPLSIYIEKHFSYKYMTNILGWKTICIYKPLLTHLNHKIDGHYSWNTTDLIVSGQPASWTWLGSQHRKRRDHTRCNLKGEGLPCTLIHVIWTKWREQEHFLLKRTKN